MSAAAASAGAAAFSAPLALPRCSRRRQHPSCPCPPRPARVASDSLAARGPAARTRRASATAAATAAVAAGGGGGGGGGEDDDDHGDQHRPRAAPAPAPAPPPLLMLRTLLPRGRSACVLRATGGGGGGGGGGEVGVDLVDDVLRGAPDVVVLGWLRHFGCTLCVRQAAEWNATLRPALERGVCGERGSGRGGGGSGGGSGGGGGGVDRGPRVVVALVGSGTIGQAVAFAEQTGFAGTLYTDPELETYTALGFARGVQSVFNLPALAKVVQSFREGHRQRWSVRAKDPFLQGGALLLDGTGAVTLLHRDRFAGDHAPIDTLVAAAEEICASCDQQARAATDSAPELAEN